MIPNPNTIKRKEKKQSRDNNKKNSVWHLDVTDPLLSPATPMTPPGPESLNGSSIIELKEELTPKRPLRSERFSRPSSSVSSTVFEDGK